MLATDTLLANDFLNNPESGTTSDAMTIVRPDGCALRLPDFSIASGPIKLMELGGYEIQGEALLPVFRKRPDGILNVPRFAVRITRDNRAVYHRRYLGDQANLTHALEAALNWLGRYRRCIRLSYILSPPLLFLWSICLGLGWFFEPVLGWFSFLPLFVSIPFGWWFAPLRPKKAAISASLAGFVWDRNDFCRGWLITGDTGAGKTFAINALMHSVFRHESDWGGLCCDEKGIYYETLIRMAGKYGRQDDLLLLQTRPNHVEDDWIPPARFNLLSDFTIPWSTYASVIVDTASALNPGAEDKGFFKTQAHANIGRGIQLFRLLNVVPTMHHLLEVLQSQPLLKAMLQNLEPLKNQGHADVQECYEHFTNAYLRQPSEQLGGVISTIYNYLNYFTNPDIVEIFGTQENTFDFSALDNGAIICLSMPQKYQTERRYVTTILKLLFYTHALRRFDPRPPGKRPACEDNLLICWQDEAQRFISDSDCNVDVIRQANSTTIMAAQSKTSFFPALGTKEKAEVAILNLRNRIIFRAADKSCAESSADFIGRRMQWKKSYTRGKNNTSTTRSREEEYFVKPYELMSLPKFTAIVKHCEKGFHKTKVHPIDPEGKTPQWYSRFRIGNA
jgi:hypothetical protein